jgi:hypothetical protein
VDASSRGGPLKAEFLEQRLVETRKTMVSSGASMRCACQHGMAITSPGSMVSVAPPSGVMRAWPLTTA